MPDGRLKERVEVKPHPGGIRGAMMSLEEVAKRAWAARNDPRVRAWTAAEIARAGWPQSRRARVQAIADGYRRKVKYLEDPVKTEFMAGPVQILCLDDHGLCIVGADCDEASITGMACCLSVGIAPVQAVGASYGPPVEQPTHVYFRFADEQGTWVPVDLTSKYPVGRVFPTKREWYVEPDMTVGAAGLPGGDFVGVGAPPSAIDRIVDEVSGWHQVRRPRR